MCVTLIGGMDRLENDYIRAAQASGHTLRFISRNEKNFIEKIGNPDRLIVFTNKVSHEARRKAMLLARQKNIPLFMLHSCGVSTLRDCLQNAGA